MIYYTINSIRTIKFNNTCATKEVVLVHVILIFLMLMRIISYSVHVVYNYTLNTCNYIYTVAKIKLMCSEVMIEKSLKGLKVESIPGRRRPIAK